MKAWWAYTIGSIVLVSGLILGMSPRGEAAVPASIPTAQINVVQLRYVSATSASPSVDFMFFNPRPVAGRIERLRLEFYFLEPAQKSWVYLGRIGPEEPNWMVYGHQKLHFDQDKLLLRPSGYTSLKAEGVLREQGAASLPQWLRRSPGVWLKVEGLATISYGEETVQVPFEARVKAPYPSDARL